MAGPSGTVPPTVPPRRGQIHYTGSAVVTRDYGQDLGQARALEIMQDILRDTDNYDLDEEIGCWMWLRAPSTTGRPSIKRYTNAQLAEQVRSGVAPARNSHVNFLVYRVSYLAEHGRDITVGNVASHLCDRALCFNPLHIVDEPQMENVSRIDCRGEVWCPDHPGHLLISFCQHQPKCIRRTGDCQVNCCLTTFQGQANTVDPSDLERSQDTPVALVEEVANAPSKRPSISSEVAPEIPETPTRVSLRSSSVALPSSDPVRGPGRKRKYSDVRSVVGEPSALGEGGTSPSGPSPHRRLRRRLPNYAEASQVVLASILSSDPQQASGPRFQDDLDHEVAAEELAPGPTSDEVATTTSSCEGSSLGGFIVPDSSPTEET